MIARMRELGTWREWLADVLAGAGIVLVLAGFMVCLLALERMPT